MASDPASPERPLLPVVAAVIRGGDGRILIARRPEHLDQGGLWEFPGGKLEAGESQREGLYRELDEELGIRVSNATPLLQITHDYPARRVVLHVFEVTRWQGEPVGREGQPLRWVEPEALLDHAFPAANLPIITAARLPRWCLVTPEPSPADAPRWLQQLETAVEAGARLVQLRAPGFTAGDYVTLAQAAIARVHARGGRILLNADPALALALGADGVHLNAGRLRAAAGRVLPAPLLVSAACHDDDELGLARALGCDFVLVSPVAETSSHPGVAPLGWAGLERLARGAQLPVYALGGMTSASLPLAVAAGCVGVAAITAAWQAPARMEAASAALRERAM